jgi:signal transduction histidine kinase
MLYGRPGDVKLASNMSDLIATWSPLLAFLVSASLFAWCLLRAARSTPSLLLTLLIGCFAEWNLFEWLWWFTDKKIYDYVQLEYVGVAFAPTVAFHYALSLEPPSRLRSWSLTAVYSCASVFLAIALAGFVNTDALDLFKANLYSWGYLSVFIPVVLWTIVLFERSRRRAQDARIRALFSYPLAAGLLMAPTGFVELAIPLFGWTQVPRLASLGALAGSVVLALGVFRYRTVYDAFAVLRRDSANVLRATVQGVLYLEPDGRVVFSNSVARDLLGIDPKTLAETGLEIPASGRSIVRRGNLILEVRTAPSEDVFPPGRISLILQNKTRDFELMQTLASKEALAALGQGAATLTHEIRNPLTAINSTLDCIVHDAGNARPPLPEHVALIRSEVRRLNDLLEKTLEFSRPLVLRRTPCDLNDLIRRVLKRGGAESPVNIRLASDLPIINADSELLAHLLENLVRNGVEASREVRVATERWSGGALLRVTSVGARIPDDVLPRLFEPFFTTKAKGTGLGLALSKKVATAHDGDIAGRNTEEGVDFEVRLPL